MSSSIIDGVEPPSETQLTVNGVFDAEHPNLFRTSSDKYIPERLKMLVEGKVKIIDENGEEKVWTRIPPRDGLDDLGVSGCSQFNLQGIDWIIEQLEAKGVDRDLITIVDLREESHCILNGQAVSWYKAQDNMNIGKENLEVERVEVSHVEWLRQQETVGVGKISKKFIDHIEIGESREYEVMNILTERHLVRDLKGLGYVRIPITDHLKPEDDDGDAFRALYDSLPKNAHIACHCAGGCGRTSSLMLFFDMMKNFRNSTLTVEDYVIRHWLIGSMNLFGPPADNWKVQVKLERMQFIRQYFKYIQDMGSGDRVYYRTWLAKQ